MVLVIPTTFIICTVSRGKSKKYHQHSEQLASSQRDAVITILFITLIFFCQASAVRTAFAYFFLIRYKVLDYLKGVQEQFSRCHTDSTNINSQQ